MDTNLLQQLSKEELRKELLLELFNKSYRYSKEPIFKLAYKNELSNFYINAKETTYHSSGMLLIGTLIYKLIQERSLDISAIGGLTLGADAIANSTAVISSIHGDPLNSFTIRKEEKTYGSMKRIEGAVKEGDKVLVVDDVVTTGKSTKTAIDICREEGLIVNDVIVLVDREEKEDGITKIRDKEVLVTAIFKASELLQLYEEKKISEEERNYNPNQQWALSG